MLVASQLQLVSQLPSSHSQVPSSLILTHIPTCIYTYIHTHAHTHAHLPMYTLPVDGGALKYVKVCYIQSVYSQLMGMANVSLIGCPIHNRNGMDSIWHGSRWDCVVGGGCLFMYI